MREQGANPAPVSDRTTAATLRRSRDADKLLMGTCAHSAAFRTLRHPASHGGPLQCNPFEPQRTTATGSPDRADALPPLSFGKHDMQVYRAYEREARRIERGAYIDARRCNVAVRIPDGFT